MYLHRRPPKSPAVAPGRGFPSFVVLLGQGNGRDTRVRVAVESHRDKEGRSFFMGRGKYYESVPGWYACFGADLIAPRLHVRGDVCLCALTKA